jgi:hypothetical protein
MNRLLVLCGQPLVEAECCNGVSLVFRIASIDPEKRPFQRGLLKDGPGQGSASPWRHARSNRREACQHAEYKMVTSHIAL